MQGEADTSQHHPVTELSTDEHFPTNAPLRLQNLRLQLMATATLTQVRTVEGWSGRAREELITFPNPILCRDGSQQNLSP